MSEQPPSLGELISDRIDGLHTDASEHRRQRVLVVEQTTPSPGRLLETAAPTDREQALELVGQWVYRLMNRLRLAGLRMKPTLGDQLMESIEGTGTHTPTKTVKSPGRLLEQAATPDLLRDAMERIGERRGTA